MEILFQVLGPDFVWRVANNDGDTMPFLNSFLSNCDHHRQCSNVELIDTLKTYYRECFDNATNDKNMFSNMNVCKL